MFRKLKVAIVQMLVSNDKQQNITLAVSKIKEAAQHGAKLIILPECFNSPYGTAHFEPFSEFIPGETTNALGEAAKANKIWLIGGTIPERNSNGKLYNTCPIYTPEGSLFKTYRKMHLFDIDIPGKITFKESETLSAGNNFCTFDCDQFKVGLGICYDIRFPEFSTILAQAGCNLLIFPAAFNTTTGPLHWHLLQRARAVDQASYILTASPARSPDSKGYQAYGHSLIVAPMGDIIAEAGEGEEIIYAELDPALPTEMRKNIPALKQKRSDLYSISQKDVKPD